MLFSRRLTLSGKFTSKTVSRGSRSQRRHRRDSAIVLSPICCAPAVEELESRQMLSAVATTAASTLAVPTYVIGARLGSGIKPSIQPNTVAPITPAEMRVAYGMNQISFNGVTGDGSGQTVAIVDAYNDPNIIGDAATFNSQFGLQQFNVAGGPTFKVLGQTGTTTLPTVNGQGWDLEESLDVEWVHAMAPKANIILFEANSNSGDDLYTAELTAAGYPGVSVISNSWGGGEYSTETSDDGSFFVTPAGHQGVTFLASTGDNGTPAGYPSYSSDVVAVGGTNLQIQSDGTYISESAWSSGGGGISQFESQPSYQVGKVNGLSPTQRTVPDVSADADPNTGVFVYDSFSGSWYQVGGTSLSCPLWAGMVAVADQGRILAGETTLNGATQTLPMLYNLPSTDFHDVVTGNNGTYSAGPGYDLTTGRGTPYANLVVPALAGYGTTAPSVVGPATGSVTENSFLTFSSANGNQITATDPFSAGNPDSMTLSVSNGTVTLGSTTGLTFLAGANGSASVTVSGTLGSLNAAINGLTYQPTTNYVGSDTLVVSVTDGGESLTGTMNVALTVNAVSPPALNGPATATVTENGSLAFSTANANLLSISDNGATGTADTATLTVSHGTVTLSSATGLIVLGGANGTATITVKGTVANLNAALNGLVYQPTTNYTGSDTLSVSIIDSHDGLSGSGSVALTISALPPAITAPASGSLTQNGSLVFSAGNGNLISVSDPGAGPTNDSLTLSVSHGTLTLGSISGLTFTSGSNGSATFTVTGTVANLSAALSGLTYQPTTNYFGSDTLAISLMDPGDTLSAAKNVALTVNALAAPSILAPGSALVAQNGSVAFSSALGNAITITDAGAGSNPDSLTLGVTHGTLTLATVSGLTFTSGSNGSATFTVSGTVANLNAALNGLTYQPTAGYTGSDSLAISVTDPGDTLTGSRSVAITVAAASPPTISAPSAASVVANGTLAFTSTNTISVADSGPGSGADSLKLTVTHGTVTFASTTGLTFTAGTNGSATFTVTGSVANLNAALSGLTYKPTAGYTGADSLAISINDNADGLSASASVAITVNAASTAPAITAPGVATTPGAAPIVFTTISIADSNAGSSVQQLSLKSTSGILKLATTSGITFISGTNNSASMVIDGTLAALNAALNGLTFTPATKNTTITLAYTDLGNGLSATATIAVTELISSPPGRGGLNVSTPLAVSPDTQNSTPVDSQTQWKGLSAAVELLAG